MPIRKDKDDLTNQILILAKEKYPNRKNISHRSVKKLLRLIEDSLFEAVSDKSIDRFQVPLPRVTLSINKVKRKIKKAQD